jgi:hypothetical protein
MLRAERPSSPSDDLSARRPWRLPHGALSPEIAEFCQQGISVCLASTDRRGEPVAGLGLACRREGAALRVLLIRRGNERLVHAIEDGAPVAATFSKPETHRSIQLKAPRARLDTLLSADEPELARQTAAMRDELVAVGYSTAFASVYCAYDRHDVLAIVMQPDQAFVQTPGPAAGSALP